MKGKNFPNTKYTVHNEINFLREYEYTIFYNNQLKLERLAGYLRTIRDRLSGLGLSLPGLLSTLTQAILLLRPHLVPAVVTPCPLCLRCLLLLLLPLLSPGLSPVSASSGLAPLSSELGPGCASSMFSPALLSSLTSELPSPTRMELFTFTSGSSGSKLVMNSRMPRLGSTEATVLTRALRGILCLVSATTIHLLFSDFSQTPLPEPGDEEESPSLSISKLPRDQAGWACCPWLLLILFVVYQLRQLLHVVTAYQTQRRQSILKLGSSGSE